MAMTVHTGWRKVTPGECGYCGFDDGWLVDGRCSIYCECQTCSECGCEPDEHNAGCSMLEVEDDEAA